MNDALPRFSRLDIGDKAVVRRAFSADDLRVWRVMAGLGTPWRTVPEPLIAGLFSYLLGEQLPGHGTNYLKQRMRFESAAVAGEQLAAHVTVTRLVFEKALVYLDTLCSGEDGRVICSGSALVLFRH